MNPVQRFPLNEAVEGLEAERELAQSQGTFGAESPLSESFEMLGRGVFRAIKCEHLTDALLFLYLGAMTTNRTLLSTVLTMEEFEELVCNPDRTGESRATCRTIAFGNTTSDKYLACVLRACRSVPVYAITAYEVRE